MADVPFRGVKALLAGVSGTGKTRSVMTCPKPVMYITSEDKYSSILPTEMDGISKVEVRSFQQFINTIIANCEESHHSGFRFKTIFIDSLTDLANLRISELRPIYKDSRQAYFQTQTEMLEIFRVIRNTDANVIGICLLDRYTDSENFTKYGPLFPGKEFQKQVPSQFDEIYIAQSRRTPEGNVEYYYQTQNDGKYECKSCSDVLPAFMEPDWTKIINMIESRSQFFDSTVNSPSY
ncbi:MAG: AAA family ATPase [Bullifex sp.]